MDSKLQPQNTQDLVPKTKDAELQVSSITDEIANLQELLEAEKHEKSRLLNEMQTLQGTKDLYEKLYKEVSDEKQNLSLRYVHFKICTLT